MTIALSITKPAVIATAANASDVNTPINEIEAILEDDFNMVQKREGLLFIDIAAPSNPASSHYKVYFKNGTGFYMRNSSGTEILLANFTSGVATDILQVQVFS